MTLISLGEHSKLPCSQLFINGCNSLIRAVVYLQVLLTHAIVVPANQTTIPPPLMCRKIPQKGQYRVWEEFFLPLLPLSSC